MMLRRGGGAVAAAVAAVVVLRARACAARRQAGEQQQAHGQCYRAPRLRRLVVMRVLPLRVVRHAWYHRIPAVCVPCRMLQQ